MAEKTYSELMLESNGYLSITLRHSEPVEINDFAGLFAGLSGQFEAYLKAEHPELRGKAQMYVREVRRGSIVAELVPNIPDLIGIIDSFLIVTGFAAIFSRRIRTLIQGQFVSDAKKSDIREIGQTIRSVSRDNKGEMRMEAVRYRDGLLTTELEITFDTRDARKAIETLDRQKESLDETESVDYERVLMTFERPSIAQADVNKRTGERVVVEDIADKSRALIYASSMAEQVIKDELRNSHENIFKRGFIVDLNVTLSQGRPVGYAVTHVHQIIDLEVD